MRYPSAGSSALSSPERFTYADYKLWPEDERWELIDGIAYGMSPAPRRMHQTLVLQLAAQLEKFFQGKPYRPHIAPVDVFWPNLASDDLNDSETITQPDLFVVCDKSKLIDEGIKGAPDFIIEVLSPKTAYRDQTEKRQLHERHKVAEYWLVNPDTLEAMIYRYRNGEYGLPQAASLRQSVAVELFPGLSLIVRPEDL